MSLNDTPSADRVHISFFGKRNAGKSSLVNAVTSQEVSVVSDIAGTTTDPVKKSMEILPLGPVVITDTPGYDDEGELGEKRVRRTKEILGKTDIAVLVADSGTGLSEEDKKLVSVFKEKNIPFIIAFSKCDLAGGSDGRSGDASEENYSEENVVFVSALTGEGIEKLKDMLASVVKKEGREKTIIADRINKGDIVVLVTPIDSSAPKGRLILPQQQVLRDVLDAGGIAVVVQDDELDAALRSLSGKPLMVITDSQVFKKVAEIVPEDITLTSFSILLANYKGFLETAVKGAAAISRLSEGDRILISEGCTHHRQCEDIGTVKLPAMIKKFTGNEILFDTSSGGTFPDDLEDYFLVLHCGACMINERDVLTRMNRATEAGIPFTNYGISIAYMSGILERSLSLFPELQKIISEKQ